MSIFTRKNLVRDPGPGPRFQPLQPRDLDETYEPPEEPRIDNLDDIALLVRRLTYGQMVELRDQLCKCAAERRVEITREMLPHIWHRWATGEWAA